MYNKVMDEVPLTQRESIPELLRQLAKNSAALIHDEIELVTLRIREKVDDVRSGAIIITAGAVIIFAAYMFFCAALILGLSYYMAPVIAALVSGTVFALVGAIIIFTGLNQLKKSAGVK